jgi:hypothetical protein
VHLLKEIRQKYGLHAFGRRIHDYRTSGTIVKTDESHIDEAIPESKDGPALDALPELNMETLDVFWEAASAVDEDEEKKIQDMGDAAIDGELALWLHRLLKGIRRLKKSKKAGRITRSGGSNAFWRNVMKVDEEEDDRLLDATTALAAEEEDAEIDDVDEGHDAKFDFEAYFRGVTTHKSSEKG